MRILLLAILSSAVAMAQSAIQAGGPTTTNSNVAAFPAAPANSVFLNAIQSYSPIAYTALGGISCCGGATNTGTYTNTFGVTSPTITSSSVLLSSTGNGYNTQSFYTPPTGCAIYPGATCTWIKHIRMDAYVYLIGPFQATEGPDFAIYTGTQQLYPSIQCGTNPSSTTPTVATWNIWGEAAGWVPTNVSCAAFLTRTNVWQHIQWLVDVNLTATPATDTYNKLFVNDQPVWNNLGVSFNGTSFIGGANTKPQFQIDSLVGAGAATMLIDRWNAAMYP